METIVSGLLKLVPGIRTAYSYELHEENGVYLRKNKKVEVYKNKGFNESSKPLFSIPV